MPTCFFTVKGKVDGRLADVARQSNPNPLNAGIFLSVQNGFLACLNAEAHSNSVVRQLLPLGY